MKRNLLKLLSLLIIIAMLSFTVACDFSAVLDDMIAVDTGNGVENGADEPIFKPTQPTLEETQLTEDKEHEETATEAPTEDETTSEAEPTDTHYSPIFDELDFEGEELCVLLRANVLTERQWYKEAPEDNLDEAIANRNRTAEETLNICVNYEIMPYADFNSCATNFNNLIITDISHGFHYYDIADHWAYTGAYASIRDCQANLLDEDMFPFFDFSLPCWNQSVCTEAVVNNRLHLITGALNTTQYDMAPVIWYNKTLYNLKKESTDQEDIQDLALAGQWTYDELYMWSKRLYEDSNGEEGKQEDDTYAFATQTANLNNQPLPKDALATAFDIDLLETYSDGRHYYNIIGNEKAATARTMWINLFKQHGTWGDGASVNNFAAGRYLFWASTMYPSKQANMTIREMEDEYGLLPLPKYDSDQAQYQTSSQDSYSLMSVLDHGESTIPTRGDTISAYLQFATELSYTSVRDSYFDSVIKPKFFGNEDTAVVVKSEVIFDIIVDNITFDFWQIYSPQLNDLAWKWRTSLLEDYPPLEMAYSAEREGFDQAIKELDTWFGLKQPK